MFVLKHWHTSLPHMCIHTPYMKIEDTGKAGK